VNSTRRACSVLSIALLAAGCVAAGAPEPDVHQLTDPAAASPSPIRHSLELPTVPADQLVREGRLLICSDLPYPPQEFFDEQGNPTGSDIELGEEIGRRLGLDVHIVNTAFDTIIEAVNQGVCDIVISAQNITAEREAQVDMIPYFQAGQTFVLRAGNPSQIHTQLDLCGKRVAAQAGTVQVDVVKGSGDHVGTGLSDECLELRKPPLLLHEYEKDDEALAALKAGEVEAYFVDSPVGGYHVVQDPQAIELAGLTLDVALQGISVPKDRPDLHEAVRSALQSMMDDGSYLAILSKFGVQEGSVAAVAEE
jgi:polar amino acid transport system substrate-binding protein